MSTPKNFYYRALIVVMTIYLIGYIGSISLISEKWTMGIAGSNAWKHLMGYGWLYGIIVGAIGAAFMFIKNGISTPIMLTVTWMYGVYAAMPFCQSGKTNDKIAGINYIDIFTCGGNIISVGLLMVIISWIVVLRKNG
jgi:hypothetical protein